MNYEKSQFNDQQIFEAILKKDTRAFSLLYDKYAKSIFGIIYAITNDQYLSEEILSRAFCMFWNLAPDYRPEKQRLFTWMLTITGKLAREGVETLDLKEIHGSDNYVDDSKENNTFGTVNSKGVLDTIFTNGGAAIQTLETAEFVKSEIKTRLRLECNRIRALK